MPTRKPCRQVVRCAKDPPVDHPLTPRDYVRIDSGYLVAYNDGEWGGGLVHYDAAGVFRQSLTDENTVRVLQTPHGLLAFTGLAHQFTEYGHVLRLERTGGAWRVRKIDFEGHSRGHSRRAGWIGAHRHHPRSQPLGTRLAC
ncbi:MAG: hypothetical protein QM820_16215 [Minicystis sp.]